MSHHENCKTKATYFIYGFFLGASGVWFTQVDYYSRPHPTLEHSRGAGVAGVGSSGSGGSSDVAADGGGARVGTSGGSGGGTSDGAGGVGGGGGGGGAGAGAPASGGNVAHLVEQQQSRVDDDVWKGSGYKGCFGEKYVSRNATVHLLARANPTQRVRITCWIMTRRVNVKDRLQYVMSTWARDCDHVLLVSKDDLTAEISSLTDAKLVESFKKSELLKVAATRNGRDALAEQAQAAWKHLHDKYMPLTDFFLRSDDDAYFVMPTLRQFLSDKNTEYPIYFGHLMCEPSHKLIFNSGGAGYVLTKAALRALARKLQGKDLCHGTGIDDWKDGLCLRQAGVLPLNTVDNEGKERFIPMVLRDTLQGNIYKGQAKYWTTSNAIRRGMDCCSKEPISFHYVRGTQQLEYHYAFSSRLGK